MHFYYWSVVLMGFLRLVVQVDGGLVQGTATRWEEVRKELDVQDRIRFGGLRKLLESGVAVEFDLIWLLSFQPPSMFEQCRMSDYASYPTNLFPYFVHLALYPTPLRNDNLVLPK